MEYTHSKTLIKIAIADDHSMVREALCRLINTWDNCKVIAEADSGQELIDRIDSKNLPDLIVVDLGMPGMNGFEIIATLKRLYPSLKFLVISIYQGEETIIRLLKAGAQGFVHKSEEAGIFKKAIYEMMRSGYYFSDQAAFRLMRQAMETGNQILKKDLSDEELSFLKNIVTDKTYHEIADVMGIPFRHAEYLRGKMFERFDVQSRVGLATRVLDKGLLV